MEFANLPIIPEQFELKPIEKQKAGSGCLAVNEKG